MQMRFALFALFSLMLSACTTARLEELRHAEPNGTPFQNALAAEYLAFAEAEAKAYDWWSMSVFSTKGLSAVYGNEPAPELVSDWDVPEEMIPEFEAARERLLGVLNASNKQARPALTARAQFFYDCWLEQQEEGWQLEDIAACRRGFFDAVETLKPTPARVASKPPRTNAYIITFAPAKATLSADAVRIVKTVADQIQDLAGADIILHGYADQAGNADANMALSQQRTEAVRNALIERGVKDHLITEFAYGEAKPTLKGGKGSSSARRVEVLIRD